MSRPAGTGSPRFRPIVNADREDHERLMAEMTTPSTSSTTSTTVVPPAGTGTVQEEVLGDSTMVTVPDFDIDDPNNILFTVSILQHPLSANLDRYDLIRDNNITKSTVDDYRQNFIDQMEAAGQSYDPFPIIDWKKVKGSKKPAGKKIKKPPPSPPDDDETLGVNGQRFGSFLPNFISAHAWCSKRDRNVIPHGNQKLLG